MKKWGWASRILTEEERATCESILRNGGRLYECCKAIDCGYVRIRKFASEIGWNFSWKNSRHSKSVNGFSREKITKLWNNGVKMQQIADKCGVSRQRIDQVLIENGINKRLVIDARIENNRKQKEIKRALEIERIRSDKLKRAEKTFEKLLELWKKGKTYRQMAEELKRPQGSIQISINRARKQYGWFFPLRRPRTVKGKKIFT